MFRCKLKHNAELKVSMHLITMHVDPAWYGTLRTQTLGCIQFVNIMLARMHQSLQGFDFPKLLAYGFINKKRGPIYESWWFTFRSGTSLMFIPKICFDSPGKVMIDGPSIKHSKNVLRLKDRTPPEARYGISLRENIWALIRFCCMLQWLGK